MADDFQLGICSGNWWNAARTGGFDSTAMSAAAASVSSSASTVDINCTASAIGWAGVEMTEPTARSCDDPAGSVSGSSITYQDSQLMNSTMQIPGFGLPATTMDWNQALLKNSGRAEASFHAMLQDDMSSRPFLRQDLSIDSDQVRAPGTTEDTSENPYRDMNQSFLVDQNHGLSSDNEPGGSSLSGFQVSPASYGCSTNVLQGLFESDARPHQSIYNDNRSMDFQSPMMGYHGMASSEPSQTSWPKITQFLQASVTTEQQPINHLQFSNNTQFWNAPAAAASELRSGLYPPMASQFVGQTFEQKPSCSNLTAKFMVQLNLEGVRESSSSVTKKKSSSGGGGAGGGGGSDQTFKKPRIETPSPLPSFKVRKEKLGDRITALQQLVSPFGKTDTASVLHEAIEYIKFLHDQVSVLSTPYLKNGHPMQYQQNPDKSKDDEGQKQDLRSRGLCLVPVSSTYPVANETPTDFWTPTFGGTYR